MANQQVWAVVYLSLVAASPFIAWLLALRHRGHYSSWEFTLYSLAYAVCRLLWRVSIVGGADSIEGLQQGGVLIANHRCSVDPCFVQLAAGRRVHWMVASEYCRHFLFGPILRVLKVIPSNRGGVDSKAIKTAIRYCQEGRLVGMFPEGRLNRLATPLLPIRAGAAVIALRAKVPLIPIWIEGAPDGDQVWSPFIEFARVSIRVGKPIFPPEATRETLAGDDDDRAKKWLQSAMTEVLRLGNRLPFAVTFAGKNWKTVQHQSELPAESGQTSR